MNPLKLIIFIISGSLFVVLGVVGIFIPLLPTTPFLLLAAACYIRSSERLYTWLMHNKWFGDYIRSYREGQGIPKKIKIAVLLFLWLTIGYSVLFVLPHWILKTLLICIAVGVSIHIISLKNMRKK